MVKRVKSKKRKPKSDPQFQYEVVFNKKKKENLASKKAEETDDIYVEKYVGQHAEEDNKIAENDTKNDKDDEAELSGGEKDLFTKNDTEIEEDDEEIAESIEEAKEDECKEEDEDEDDVEQSEYEVESSSTGIESSEYNSEKEEAKVIDVDKHSPRQKDYRQRNISKSHILQKLETQKRDVVRAFFYAVTKPSKYCILLTKFYII